MKYPESIIFPRYTPGGLQPSFRRFVNTGRYPILEHERRQTNAQYLAQNQAVHLHLQQGETLIGLKLIQDRLDNRRANRHQRLGCKETIERRDKLPLPAVGQTLMRHPGLHLHQQWHGFYGSIFTKELHCDVQRIVILVKLQSVRSRRPLLDDDHEFANLGLSLFHQRQIRLPPASPCGRRDLLDPGSFRLRVHLLSPSDDSTDPYNARRREDDNGQKSLLVHGLFA